MLEAVEISFEFFFGLFGLISSNSSSRNKLNANADWLASSGFNAGQAAADGLVEAAVALNAGAKQQPANNAKIFSTSGTLSNSGASDEPVFSSVISSSSAGSSGSISTLGSTVALVKPGELDKPKKDDGKKYQFMFKMGLGETGQKPARGYQSPSPVSPDDAKLFGAGDPLDSDDMAALEDDGRASAERPAEANRPRLEAEASGGAKSKVLSERARSIYCLVVCLGLWVQVVRLVVGMSVERSLFTLDVYYLGANRMHFLIPALCVAIQTAAVSIIFIQNNYETNWLVPFYSCKDYLIRSRSNFRPRIEDYARRVRLSISLGLALATVSSLSLAAFMVHCCLRSDAFRALFMQLGLASARKTPSNAMAQIAAKAAQAAAAAGASNASAPVALAPIEPKVEQAVLLVALLFDVLWAVYATYICFLVSFYFNLICSIMRARFRSIGKIIEDLAESNTCKTTNQARKITTLYLEHNEACELLDESNDFWQYLIFFTYFTYIPAYCYCLYNLFFVDFDPWPYFITWVLHTHMGFVILLISFSAAGVSTEAHAPYTSLHTLSLIQLPLDVEVNITTFLHRVRGLTIGYSCYDLFAITNASMSNTAAACASYFLIVADFSRSSVFSVSQLNQTMIKNGSLVLNASAVAPTPLSAAG